MPSFTLSLLLGQLSSSRILTKAYFDALYFVDKLLGSVIALHTCIERPPAIIIEAASDGLPAIRQRRQLAMGGKLHGADRRGAGLWLRLFSPQCLHWATNTTRSRVLLSEDTVVVSRRRRANLRSG